MKLKERVLISVMAGLVMLTMIVVLEAETNLTAPSRPRTPAHARVHYAFRQRHLQKTSNASREASLSAAASAQIGVVGDDSAPPPPPAPDALAGVGADGGREKRNTTPTTPPDSFSDLAEAVLVASNSSKVVRRRKHWNPRLGELLGLELR